MFDACFIYLLRGDSKLRWDKFIAKISSRVLSEKELQRTRSSLLRARRFTIYSLRVPTKTLNCVVPFYRKPYILSISETVVTHKSALTSTLSETVVTLKIAITSMFSEMSVTLIYA